MSGSPVDNSKFYVTTDHHMRDQVYNWIIARYGKKGHPWTTSDKFVWYGAVYFVWDWIWLLIFIYFIYAMGNLLYNKYGLWKAVMFVVVMVLIRFNSLIKKVDQTNRLLKEKL